MATTPVSPTPSAVPLLPLVPAAAPHTTAAAAMPSSLARVDQWRTHLQAVGGVMHDFGQALLSGRWARPVNVTVPVPPGSPFPAPEPPKTGLRASVEALGELAWTYGKHVAMPTLNPDQEVVGYVTGINNAPNPDGDFVMDVVPLPAYHDLLNYKGRPLPHMFGRTEEGIWQHAKGRAMVERCGAVHVEVKMDRQRSMQPFVNDVQRAVLAGDIPVVAVRGRLTMDRYHAPGWIEIHPARSGRMLSPTGAGFPEPLPTPGAANLPASPPD